MANPSWAAEEDGVAAVCAATSPLASSLLSRPLDHPERGAGLMRARMHLKSVLGKIEAADVQRGHPGLDSIRKLLQQVETAEAAAAVPT